MKKNTLNAIMKRIRNGYNAFFIGEYYYYVRDDGTVRRREQRPGYMYTSDWETVLDLNEQKG